MSVSGGVVIVILILIGYVIMVMNSKKVEKKREAEYYENQKKEALQKREMNIREAYKKYYDSELDKLGIIPRPLRFNFEKDHWYANERYGADSNKNFYILSASMNSYNMTDNINQIADNGNILYRGSSEEQAEFDVSKLIFKPIKYEKIAYDDIVFFTKSGNVSYTTEISGGGVSGGGSSLTGAIIGGAIAGNTGAIIGSRKEITSDPITTRTVEHNDTRTVMRYKDGDQYRERTFDGFMLYDYLITVMGEKDLLQMQLNQMNKATQ